MVSSIKKYLNATPDMVRIPSFDPKPETGWQGVEAISYSGAVYQGKKTKIFAYIGFPKENKGEKVPAVVLVHGGGGHAYAHWVKLWNDRGYAAIAMDTTGFYPSEECRGLAGKECGKNENYTRELYGELEAEGYTSGPNNDALINGIDLPIEEQWMYHAIVDTILAHNILLNDERIDSDKIGICGISWGAVITTLALGYDSRYAFAIPIYGTAYLEDAPESLSFCDKYKPNKVKQTWCATAHISKINIPVYWMCTLIDRCFCFASNSKSYLATKEQGASFSICYDLIHGHYHAWDREEGYRFADAVLQNKLPFICAKTEPQDLHQVQFQILIPDDFEDVEVSLVYLTAPLEYDEKDNLLSEHHKIPVELNNDIVSAKIPESAYGYYFEFSGCVNGKTMISSTSFVEIDR
jgi:cephalosporin-C deacetylase-like acetyl esterase